ncbi:MAG TPA: SymE family type I addiction module toxin [Dokdonella sp.]
MRLSGRWLEALGFVVGGQVRIEVQDGALRLTPLPADAEGAPPSGGVKP